MPELCATETDSPISLARDKMLAASSSSCAFNSEDVVDYSVGRGAKLQYLHDWFFSNTIPDT